MAVLKIRQEDGSWAEIPALVGPKGEQGEPGKDGVSVTHSWSGTVLSVTSASGTTSADLKGERGEQGIQGDSYVLTESDKAEIAALVPIPDDYVTEDELTAKGYMTSYTETDPTVPAWAKAETKPSYTAFEVGALPDTTVIPTVPTNVSAFTNDAGYLDSESDPTVPAWAKEPTKPTYTAAEVGALPSTTVVPSNTEQWTFTLEDGSTVTKAVYLA